MITGAGLVTAVLSALILRDPYVTGDSVYHLIWGRELAHGALDTFAPGPTPHPLVLAAGAATSLLGDEGSYTATWLLFGPVALGATIAALVCIGLQLGNRVTALLAAATLAVNETFFGWVAAARYDIAFGALVLWALAAHLARPRNPFPVLGILALAGIVRPEAWLVSGLYWLWAARRLSWHERAMSAGLVGLAPLCWMAMDAAVMGDFLYSLHFTESASRELTDRFTRDEHASQALVDLARATGLLTLLAAALILIRRPAGVRPLLALLAVTLGIFALLLVDGLPNERYLIVPALSLILVAALAATPAPGRARWVALTAGALLVMQAIVFAPAAHRVAADYEPSVDAEAEVRSLLARPNVRAMFETCPDVTVTAYRQSWAYWSGRSPTTIRLDDKPATPPDVYVVPADSTAAARLLTRKFFDDDTSFTVPAPLHRGPGGDAWRIYFDPGSGCVRRALDRS